MSGISNMKAKEAVHKHYTLVDEVFTTQVQVNYQTIIHVVYWN